MKIRVSPAAGATRTPSPRLPAERDFERSPHGLAGILGEAGLAMRRLSIIDTSAAGHQPFFSENKRFVITYNGELYNYREVRAELEKKGHKFTTKSDTEILPHLYEEYGDGLLEHVNGMYAFSLWDARAKKLIIARDRFGALLALGVTALLAVHVFVNIAMTIGLVPVKGIPLPFISHGGTFVLSCCLLQGLVQSVYRFRRDT